MTQRPVRRGRLPSIVPMRVRLSESLRRGMMRRWMHGMRNTRGSCSGYAIPLFLQGGR